MRPLKRVTIKFFEDNAGGLRLYVRMGKELRLFDGLERQDPDDAAEFLRDLACGILPPGWDASNAPDIDKIYESDYTFSELIFLGYVGEGSTAWVDNIETYPEDAGYAGSLVLDCLEKLS